MKDLYTGVAKELKNNIEKNNTPYYTGRIEMNNWKLNISCVVYSDGHIVPIWWEFFLNDSPDNEFCFDEFNEIYKKI